MADQRAVAVLLAMVFVRSIPTAALRNPQASTGADGKNARCGSRCKLPVRPTAPAAYILGGGYIVSSGRSAEASCDAVNQQPITTFEECRSAAEQVGVTIQEMVGPGTWNHVPYGCSVLQGTATPQSGAVGTNGRVHFSTTPGINNHGGAGGYVLICKKVASRIAVFSAQFGGRDHVHYRLSHDSQVEVDEEDGGLSDVHIRKNAEKLPGGVDAFLFTDMVNVVQDPDSPWNFVNPAQQFEELCDDNVLCSWKALPNLTQSQKTMQAILASKFYKMRWIAENTQYDYIIWMDGKYEIKNQNLTETVRRYMRNNLDMLALKHPNRQTVEEELSPASSRAADILQDNSTLQKASSMYDRYKREGFSDTPGELIDSAMFIVRPARVRDMLLDWWHEVQQGVPRDQLSLPWMVQKHGIKVYRLNKGACAILGRGCRSPGAHK